MESTDLIIGEMNEEYVTQVVKEMADTINREIFIGILLPFVQEL